MMNGRVTEVVMVDDETVADCVRSMEVLIRCHGAVAASVMIGVATGRMHHALGAEHAHDALMGALRALHKSAGLL